MACLLPVKDSQATGSYFQRTAKPFLRALPSAVSGSYFRAELIEDTQKS